MKHWWMLFAYTVLVTSCHHHDDEPTSTAERVVIMYIMAENSLSPYASYDLAEVRKATGDIPEGCKLVVYLDESNNQQTPRILTFTREKGEQKIYQYSNDPVSTDSTTVQEVLGRIMAMCPARHYGLVMWSHGSGWIPAPHAPQRTIGMDNGRNTTANTGTELETATLARILENTGLKWDYIFFDACFMQGVEVAYQLRHATDWCIGSPAEIPANGAPYDQIMQALFAAPDDAWRIAKKYADAYGNYRGVVISAIRTEELETLAEATAPYTHRIKDFPAADVQAYCTYTAETRWKPEYFDMGSVMAQWLSDEEYTLWLEALDRAVPYRYAPTSWVTAYSSLNPTITDAEHVASLSMYIPIEGRDELNKEFTLTDWYQACGWH